MKSVVAREVGRRAFEKGSWSAEKKTFMGYPMDIFLVLVVERNGR